MNKVIGASMIFVGGLVVFGGLTGRLPAMLAAIFKPADLTTADGAPGGILPNAGDFAGNVKAGAKHPARTAVDSVPIVGSAYELLRGVL